MTKRSLLATVAGVALGGILFNAVPALADLPVTDPASDTILNAIESGFEKAISTIGTNSTNALTDLTNPNSVSSLLTAGFSQNANYSKAQIGAQEQVADATNTIMTHFQLNVRDSEMRDEHTTSPLHCTAIDSGQTVAAASKQGSQTQLSIEHITDQRGEGEPGFPAYYGTAQAMQAASNLHHTRYCSALEAESGACSQTNTPDGDERASSLFGNGNLQNVDGLNAANDYASNLIQPIVPAAIRMDQLNSIAGQDAYTKRRSYNARMSLARSILSWAIGLQAPGVNLTSDQQTELTNEGLPASTTGSWLQILALEVNRRVGDVAWAAGLQQMTPASVQREIAMELALGNYIALQNFRAGLIGSSINATQMAIAEEAAYRPMLDMPSPSVTASTSSVTPSTPTSTN